MTERLIMLNVLHRAGSVLHLNGCRLQRCVHCGELLWDQNMRGDEARAGAYVEVVLREDASAAVAETRVVTAGSGVPMCYRGWADKAGHVLLPRETRAAKCRACAQGQEPALLDDDGVIFGVSGEPGTWGHAVDDAWSPCRGVR